MKEMKDTKNIRNKLLYVIACILLISFIILGTICWYNYFKGLGNSVGNINNSTSKNNIVLVDSGKSVQITDAESVDDDQVNDVIPYTFNVINKNQKDYNYILYIEDLPVSVVNDGCTDETLLERQKLKYQLKLNDVVIKEELLSNIKDNILDERSISVNQENKYELRVFIHDTAIDWEGKHYHYRVVLDSK